MDTLDRLFNYMHWANKTWLDYVMNEAADDPYLTKTISHIYLAEQAWFQRLYQEDLDSRIFEPRPYDELNALSEKHAKRFPEVAAGDLSRRLAYRRFNGEAYETAVGDILLHIITHASHHRGQMARYAAQNNLNAPTTDFITYCRNMGL